MNDMPKKRRKKNQEKNMMMMLNIQRWWMKKVCCFAVRVGGGFGQVTQDGRRCIRALLWMGKRSLKKKIGVMMRITTRWSLVRLKNATSSDVSAEADGGIHLRSSLRTALLHSQMYCLQWHHRLFSLTIRCSCSISLWTSSKGTPLCSRRATMMSRTKLSHTHCC